jgi:hypothetical protein
VSHTIAELIAALPADPWRAQEGFSPDLAAATASLLAATTDQERQQTLSDWLRLQQPCLFGKAAAALGFIHYCILTPDDLQRPDEWIRDKIQAERLAWHRAAFNGQKSGFVILALSDAVARAIPGETTRQLARVLCSLYLLTDVELDEIHLDNIHLQVPGPAQRILQWKVGVNYFCAQGDRRWWQDHRIPGGMAFSMNSVGHMVKSRVLAQGMNALEEMLLGASTGDWVHTNIDTLERALILAMRTIEGASVAPSGRATELLPLPADTSNLPKCPYELPAALVQKNYCSYGGYYHTDVTLPLGYFVSDVQRPVGAQRRNLDFTYLFHGAVSNPDYYTMGAGIPVRAVDGSEPSPLDESDIKRLKGREIELSSSESDLLIARLFGP